jgi:hypothetical protein
MEVFSMSMKCLYVVGCPMYNYLTTAIRIIQIQPFLSDFCLNGDNYQNCARYRIRQQGSEPPDTLLPNGTTLKP